MAGRPPAGKKQVSIRLQEETIQILHEASILENRSPSELVEELIKCTFPKEVRKRYRIGLWEFEEECYLHKKYIVIPQYYYKDAGHVSERQIELHYSNTNGKWYYEDVVEDNNKSLSVHVFLDFASCSRIVCNNKNEKIDFNIEDYELEQYQQVKLLRHLQRKMYKLRIQDVKLYYNRMRNFIEYKGLVNEFNTYYSNEEDGSFKDWWWK